MLKNQNLYGEVGVSDVVIIKISAIIALGCYGVLALSDKGKGKRVKLTPEIGSTRGVKVKAQKGAIAIDIYIVAAYGVNMDSISANIRDGVIYQVEKMTGCKVSCVNVRVDEIGRVN